MHVVKNDQHESDSVHRSSPIFQSKQENFVIHNCLTKKMAILEESFQFLLDSYPEALHAFNDDGYLPIHLACIYHSINLKILDMIMRANS